MKKLREKHSQIQVSRTYDMEECLEHYQFNAISCPKDTTELIFHSMISNIASKATINDIVFVVISAHGKVENGVGGIIFFKSDGGGNEIFIDYPTINNWLKEITCAKMILIIDACRSGSAREDMTGGNCPRVIYCSCQEDELSTGYFIDKYTLVIGQYSYSVNEADQNFGNDDEQISTHEAYLWYNDFFAQQNYCEVIGGVEYYQHPSEIVNSWAWTGEFFLGGYHEVI